MAGQGYFADIAKAYSTELKVLYDAGVRNVQVDDPNLACGFLRVLELLASLIRSRFLFGEDDRGLEEGQ